MDTMDLQLWQQYRAGERPFSRSLRDELILRYTPLVRYVANRMKARLPANVLVEDLVQCGMFGLIEAIDRFEPEREVKFETFAVARIQGSILDELRAMDWAPRSVRARVRIVHRARVHLEQTLLRQPTVAEIADQLGWDVGEVYQVQSEADSSYVNQLEASHAEQELGRAVDVEDLTADDPVLSHEVDLTRTLLAKAVTRLPEKERAVAAMYWRGGRCPSCHGDDEDCRRCQGEGSVPSLTLAEIGQILGASESWVCQVYTSAAQNLRNLLADLR